jgi:hypothetical protein
MARGTDQREVPKVQVHQSKNYEKLEPRWWTVKDEDTALHLFPLVKDIERRQLYQRAANLRHAKLYSNQDRLSIQGGTSGPSVFDLQSSQTLSLNVIKACVDTVASKIAKAKPRPMFLTEDGNWSLQRRARQLTKFTDGAFDRMDFYKKYQMAFRDAEIFGTGAVKFYKEGSKVQCERTLIDELIVDDAEAIYGTPQQLHQVRYMHRDILSEQFPDKKAAIQTAAPGFSGSLLGPSSIHMIRVVESWHLASGPGAKDGKHAICIDGTTLVCEPYKRKRFPFIFIRWSPRLTGFFGAGMAEELIGIQMEIRKILRTIQKAQHIMCVPRVWIEANSSVNKQLTNEIGGVGVYTGTAPMIQPGTAMSGEIYSHLENLYQKAYEIVGVSQLSATAKKPAGLDSGIALREYQDIESERFQLVSQNYDDGSLDAAELVIEMTKEIYASAPDLLVTIKSGKTIKQIKWKEIDMERDEYEMRSFPTSILPTTPAGKLQTVQELIQAGMIDRENGLSLLDFPDLESVVSLYTAALEDIKRCIELMIDEGEYQVPEPFMNLPLAIKTTQSAYLKARTQSVPEERLELLRRFIEDCEALITQANTPQDPAAAPGMDPAMGEAQAVPEAQPTSDLMPQVPQADPMAAMGVVQ